ncbi:MAG: HAD family hydrolase [Actinomycetota bacterium]|nr:HAD family hydrolase [Actinomycetota bacterium]
MDSLVLWDIDGTLLNAGGLGAEVFDRALDAALGARPPERVAMSGKTDPQIVGEYLDMLGIGDRDAHLPAVLAALERELEAAEQEIRDAGRVLPGVPEAIAAIAALGSLQSVLTGNIAPNARRKLAIFGLDGLLDLEVGAFGSDHADRRELVPVALGRVRATRGRSFDPSRVWIVGDSANDLACARAGGVRCLLVATGRSSGRELAALGPDFVVEDLSDTGAVVDILAS